MKTFVVPRFQFELLSAIGLLGLLVSADKPTAAAGELEALAQPQEGRSMRATSTMRVGEVRRGSGERKLNPKADPRGDLDEQSNCDNLPRPAGRNARAAGRARARA